MKISITNPTDCVDKRSQNFVERRITQVLSRLTSRIQDVSLILTDENGPRGGVDKSCRVIITLRGLDPVTTTGRHENVLGAVDAALQRVRRIILKKVNRRTTRARKPLIEDTAGAATAASGEAEQSEELEEILAN